VLRLVHVDRAAAGAGIRPGQTLAEAKSLVPELVTFDDDPHKDRRQLESLAVLAGNLAPTVHIENTDTLIVDATGCQRLYGNEANMLRRAVSLFHGERFHVRVAIADTPGAAWALAHAHPEPIAVGEPDRTAAALAPLPVWSLRIDERAANKLGAVGVETIGSLLHLPRSSLTSRFGETLLTRMDQALGDQPEVLRPYRPATALTARLALGMPTDRLGAIVEAVERTVTTFCGRLERRVAGVRQVFVTFHCPDVVTEHHTESRTVTIEVTLSRATRSAKHLLALLRVRLDALSLPGPADTVMAWSRETEQLDARQTELFDTGSNDPQELGALLDRLAVRLTPGAVVRAEPVSDHQPERSFRYVTLVGRNGRSEPRPSGNGPKEGSRNRGIKGSRRRNEATEGPRDGGASDWWHGQTCLPVQSTTNGVHDAGLGARPLRLLYNPLQIHATALAPEGPPIAFRLKGVSHNVAECIGPERIETGWWRGPHVQRDYYRVLTEGGRRAWVFRHRDSGAWFLHGWFD